MSEHETERKRVTALLAKTRDDLRGVNWPEAGEANDDRINLQVRLARMLDEAGIECATGGNEDGLEIVLSWASAEQLANHLGSAGHDELCCPTCRRPYVLHGIDCPSLSTASAEEAFQGGVDPGPSRYSWRDPECREHPRCAPYEGCGGRGYLDDPQDSGSGRTVYCDCAAGVELGERESREDDEEFRSRRDLSAERYTRDDGSPR